MRSSLGGHIFFAERKWLDLSESMKHEIMVKRVIRAPAGRVPSEFVSRGSAGLAVSLSDTPLPVTPVRVACMREAL